jgi:hypothetical protein
MDDIFSSLGVAVVSSWLTVQFSLHRFRTERWWDRKIEAYAKIIESLYDVKREPEELLGADIDGREITEERKKELELDYKKAFNELLKAAGVGKFYLSETAVQRLIIYFGQHDSAQHKQIWFDHVEADWKAANSCLRDMIEIARNDLGGHLPWYNRLINGLKSVISGKCRGWTCKQKSP